jgi:hypothetical protein
MATSNLTPSQSATFASSQGELDFTKFSQSFSVIDKQNYGDTSPTAKGGTVEAQNIHVIINVSEQPPSVTTSATSQVFGGSNDYTGTAKTQSQIIANFDIEAGKVFSFDFSAIVEIQTRIDNSRLETAKASGAIFFKLFDTTDIPKQRIADFLSSLLSNDTNDKIQRSPLDFFSMTGNLNTPGNNDSIVKEKSPNVTLISEDKKFSVGGTQEVVKTAVKASFQRSFTKRINLTLIAYRRTQVAVTALVNSHPKV